MKLDDIYSNLDSLNKKIIDTRGELPPSSCDIDVQKKINDAFKKAGIPDSSQMNKMIGNINKIISCDSNCQKEKINKKNNIKNNEDINKFINEKENANKYKKKIIDEFDIIKNDIYSLIKYNDSQITYMNNIEDLYNFQKKNNDKLIYNNDDLINKTLTNERRVLYNIKDNSFINIINKSILIIYYLFIIYFIYYLFYKNKINKKNSLIYLILIILPYIINYLLFKFI